MELTKSFVRGELARALESWAWLDLAQKKPLFTSLFGDVFFEADDGCWFLDTMSAELCRRWADRSEMDAALSTSEGQDDYLLAPLARRARDEGMTLAAPEIFDFVTPPILGGDVTVENLRPAALEVALDVLGQLQEQIRDLPNGTHVKIKIDPSA